MEAHSTRIEDLLRETHPCGVLRIERGCVVSVNDAAVRLLGDERERLVGLEFLDLSPPFAPDGRATTDVWDEHEERARHTIATFPWRCLRPDGSLVELDVILASAIEGERGTMITVLRERGPIEEPSWRYVAQLADGMAHDLANRLSAIDGHLEIAGLDSRRDADLDERVGKARRSVRAADAILQRLMALGRPAVTPPEPTAISDLLARVADEVARFGPAGTRVQVSFETGLPAVAVVRSQIARAIREIAIAVAIEPGKASLVEIVARPVEHDDAFVRRHRGATTGAYARIEIAGRGPASSPEVRQFFFDPRLSRRAEYKDLGASLSLACAVVKQHRGYISAEEGREGQGEFRIDLPAASHATETVTDERASADAASRAGRTVLLVEDEGIVRTVAAEYLRGQGYDVIECASAEEALEDLERRAIGIDLLLADLSLPGMDGLSLAQRARAAHPDLKIIFTTGHATEEIAELRRVSSQEAVLAKPFELAQLAKRVRSLLEG